MLNVITKIITVYIATKITCTYGKSTLLVGSENGISEYSFSGKRTERRDIYRRIPIWSIASLVSENIVFWNEFDMKKNKTVMKRANVLPGTLVNVTVLHENVTSCGGLDVDWIHNKLYWVGAKPVSIKVSKLDGTCVKTVFKDEISAFGDIALDPFEGWMYATDVGISPKIMRIGLDGTNMEVLVNRDIEQPDCITIDHQSRVMYWLDNKLHYLKSANLDGSNIQIVLVSSSTIRYSRDLIVFGEFVVWTDLSGIYKVSMQKRQNDTREVDTLIDGIYSYGINVFGQIQPTACNYCGTRGAGCRYLCLPSPRLAPNNPKYKCVCPDRNGETCISTELQGFVENLTPCQQLVHTSSGSCQYPNCTETGYFHALQCDEISGMKTCWCSDPSGNIIPDTMMKYPKVPDCNRGHNLKPCLFNLVQYARGIRDSYKPRCTVTGEYDDAQCDQYHCWCAVVTNGEEITGTRVIRSRTPSCTGRNTVNYKVHFIVTSSLFSIFIILAVLLLYLQRRMLNKMFYTRLIRYQTQLYSDIASSHYAEINDLDIPPDTDTSGYEIPRETRGSSQIMTKIPVDDFGYLKPHTYYNGIMHFQNATQGCSNTAIKMEKNRKFVKIKQRNLKLSEEKDMHYAIPENVEDLESRDDISQV